MKAFYFTSVLICAFIVIGCVLFWNAWVVLELYKWFILPHTDVLPNVFQVMGVILIVRLLFGGPIGVPSSREFLHLMGHYTLVPLFLLIVGNLLHRWMI